MRPKSCPGVAAVAAAVLLATTFTTTARAGSGHSPTGRTDPAPRTTAERIALSGTSLSRQALPTREVHTDTPFSMVGLTWQGTAPGSMRIRHLEHDGWSTWTRLAPSSNPGRSQVHGSEPMWTGPTTGIQVRASRAGRDVTGKLELVAISPGRTPAPAPRGSARSTRPPVVTRAQWGADEDLMTWPPQYTPTTQAVIVHHTAETNDYTCEQSAEIVRGIYHYHAVELGWGDIGYQALVDKCGTIFEGRTGGLDDHVVGGHTQGFNGRTFGVAMMGSFGRIVPPRPMVDSVGAVAGWKLDKAGVDPQGTTTLVSGGGEGNRYPAGTAVPLPRIFAHRDVGETACPGRKGYAQLGTIRDRAATQQSSSDDRP